LPGFKNLDSFPSKSGNCKGFEYVHYSLAVLLDIACSRRSDRGARAKNKASERAGNLTEIQPSYLITEMFIQPKTHWNIKKNYYSNGNQFKRKISYGSLEIFLFMQITNFLTDLCCILAVFKHKYPKISVT